MNVYIYLSVELRDKWEVGDRKSRRGRRDEPGDLPGDAPQKTQIMMGLLSLPFVETGITSEELGFRLERPWGVGELPLVVEVRAGDAPPDAIVAV